VTTTLCLSEGADVDMAEEDHMRCETCVEGKVDAWDKCENSCETEDVKETIELGVDTSFDGNEVVTPVLRSFRADLL
jgi:hypothetical protein